jgi:DNA-binding NarL/FixJ family response regulator
MRNARDVAGEKLTPRQLEVLHLLCAGYTDQQTADKLGCKVKTIEAHAYAIKTRMDVSNRCTMGVEAVRRGLVR